MKHLILVAAMAVLPTNTPDPQWTFVPLSGIHTVPLHQPIETPEETKIRLLELRVESLEMCVEALSCHIKELEHPHVGSYKLHPGATGLELKVLVPPEKEDDLDKLEKWHWESVPLYGVPKK